MCKQLVGLALVFENSGQILAQKGDFTPNHGHERTVCGLLKQAVQDVYKRQGYTGPYVRVRAKAAPGEFLNVRITGTDGTLAIGEPLAEDGR